MLPIILDAAAVGILLVGRGDELESRLRWLLAGGARRLTVCDMGAGSEPGPVVDGTLVRHQRPPAEAEVTAARIVWITGLALAEAAPIATKARAGGALVNVEDAPSLCQFHTPAVVRRGDLLLTVSTAGKSPGLAQAVRRWLERQFGPEWDDRLGLIARKRAAWRRRPRALPELARLTDAMIIHRGWLPDGSSKEQRA